MKINTVFFSLVTAMGLILTGQNVNADVLASLDQASAEENWREAAKHFTKAFEEFDKGIRDILDANGGKPVKDTAITLSIWKKNILLPKYENWGMYAEHLTQDKLDDLHLRSREGMHALLWDSRDTGFGRGTTWGASLFLGSGLIAQAVMLSDKDKSERLAPYYYMHHIEPLLKAYILSTLRVKSLREAAIYWTNRFVKPVSQLLIEHSAEMKTDGKTLKRLLKLYRAYHSCEIIVNADFTGRLSSRDARAAGRFSEEELREINLPTGEIFTDVYHRFYDGLVDAILTCPGPGKMENILCKILRDSSQKIEVDEKNYYGSDFYRLNIIPMGLILEKRGRMPVSAEIGKAIKYFNENRYSRERAKLDAKEEGDAWSVGFGF